MNQSKSIIISITSDIGEAIAHAWQRSGDSVVGTYRSQNENYRNLQHKDFDLVHLDVLDKKNISEVSEYIGKNHSNWDKLVLCPATIEPIGRFENIEFDVWEESIQLNFTSQMRILHTLLPHRNKTDTPSVVLFAGGGTNNATLNYSAYTISKIATIKMTELLDAEIENVKFVIYGPGWVKTKIHDSTLKYPAESEANYQKTLEKLKSDECTTYETIIKAIDWGIGCDRKVIGGRNISIVSDKWGTTELVNVLSEDENMYKLRRDKNDWV